MNSTVPLKLLNQNRIGRKARLRNLQSRCFLGKKRVEADQQFGEFFDGLFACFGQTGPATAFSSLAGGDQWCDGVAVHGVHQIPGMLIGHFHGFCRTGDRTEFSDSLQQDYSTKAEIGLSIFFNPDPSPTVKSFLGGWLLFPPPCRFMVTVYKESVNSVKQIQVRLIAWLE